VSLHQLSKGLANGTSGWVVGGAPVDLRRAYRHTMVFPTLSVAIIVLKAERCAQAISCVASIAGPMGVIT
jgi:hypothetical protein